MKLAYKSNLKDDTLATYCGIMIAGNTILRQYHQQLKSEYSSRAVFRGAIFHKVDQRKPVRFGEVVIPKADLEKILAVRAIEVDMLEAFAGIVYKLAKKWAVSGIDHTRHDMQQEALMVLLNSIYYYTDSRVKFITFATNNIRHRMITVRNCGGLIALPDNEGNRDLLRRYDEASRELAGRVNFDAVCDRMGLDDKERDHLRDILSATTVSQSDIESGQRCRDGDVVNDFTAVSRPTPVASSNCQPGYYRHSNAEGVFNRTLNVNMNMLLALRKLIANADQLPEFDRAVLFAAMDGQYGWQAEVASRFINKVSGKPYSRQSVRWVMQRIGEMIQSIARGDEDALVSDVA